MKRSNIESYNDRMNEIFRSYLRAIKAHSDGILTAQNLATMQETEKYFDYMGDAESFRASLLRLCLKCEWTSPRPLDWAFHPVVKLGMLKAIGLTEELWILLAEGKRHRSIDDE